MTGMCSPTRVPRLSLVSLQTEKDPGATHCQPLTGGSDRSCATRLPGAPANVSSPEGCHRVTSPTSLALPPRFPQADDAIPDSMPSSPGFATPRTGGLTLESLTLHSPVRSPFTGGASWRTPVPSPRLSPHSPKSPSMMSPMRMLGARSPCSVKLSGGTTKLASNKSPPAKQPPPNAVKPKRTVNRALPFTQPTPAAVSASATKAHLQAQDLARFSQVPPCFHGRELSFSDLLDPNAARNHSLGFGLGVASIKPLNNKPVSPIVVHRQLADRDGCLPSPASPRSFGGTDTHGGGGQMTPRKRPRKSAAPQRADFGSDDGGDYSNNNNNGESSHGETSGVGGATAMAAAAAANNVAMMLEDGPTSPPVRSLRRR